MKFLYDAHGEPRAVLEGQYVHDLEGYAVGFVEHGRVFRMSGEYVGALHEDMVVDPMTSYPGPTSPPGGAGRIPPPDSPGPRGAFDYGMPDRIDRLFEGAG